MPDDDSGTKEPRSGARRHFLQRASTVAMGVGLAGGYGALGLVAGRFLYPAAPAERRWFFVTEVARLGAGQSLLYRGPLGETINVVHRAATQEGEEFIALSSTCPHLGCQVHWEAQNERYFCPCHNGTFDGDGVGTGGPPGDAAQVLPRYPMKVENGLLYIEVPVGEIAAGGEHEPRAEVVERLADRVEGPGHDPCLARGVRRTAVVESEEQDDQENDRWT